MWFDIEAPACEAGTPIPCPGAPDDWRWVIRGVYGVRGDEIDWLLEDSGCTDVDRNWLADYSEYSFTLRCALEKPTLLRVVGYLR